MPDDQNVLIESLISIASEMFRFRSVFERAVGKLDIGEQGKYLSQYAWFSKRVERALDAAGLRTVDLTGGLYELGMAAAPLNIEEFDLEDTLYVAQMMQPIIMRGTDVMKSGTVILGRIEK